MSPVYTVGEAAGEQSVPEVDVLETGKWARVRI